jgi:hypothetical protein
MANWYVSSASHSAVAQFAISHAYVIGDIVRQLATPSVGSERCFRCSTSGTSGGSESAWTLTKAATTTQGTAVFTEVTGNETYQAPGAWAAPHARFCSGLNWCATGDTVYVAANHAETQSSAMALSGNTNSGAGYTAICVDSTGSGHVPPQSGDARTTATIATTGTTAITLNVTVLYAYGLNFTLGSGAGATTLQFGYITAGGTHRYESCTFVFGATGASVINLWPNNSSVSSVHDWTDCQVTTANVGNFIAINMCNFRWKNTAGLAAVTGTAVTTNAVFRDVFGGGSAYLDGLDFSGVAHTRLILSANSLQMVLVNCKLNAATALANAPGEWGAVLDMIGGGSAGLAYYNERWTYSGTLTTDIAVVHTGGASDGTTTVSWKIVSNSLTKLLLPFEAMAIAQWNSSTGSSKTVSFEAIANASAVLTNAQLWATVTYLGTAGSVVSATGTTGLATPLTTATNITTSSVAWDSAATARANSHLYASGDVIAVSSNSGRVFFCTTLGTSSGSLPVAYATAVDGGSVTDGTAIFRAGCRMTVSLNVTPQVAGLIRVIPRVGVASTTLFIDPLLTVT